MEKVFKSLLIVVSMLIILVGCVQSGTGTVRIRNELTGGQEITSLYLYPAGSAIKGESIISSPILPNNTHSEKGVKPGDYTIEAELDYGQQTAIDSVTVEEGVIDIVWISDSDIV